jgi:N-glycosylase/DNA lyase
MKRPEASRLLHATRHVLAGLTRTGQDSHRPQWDEAGLWRELVACILGSVVPFEAVKARLGHLDSVGVLDEGRRAKNLNLFQRRMAKELARPLPRVPKSRSMIRYRFPNLRAKQIRQTAESIYRNGLSLYGILNKAADETAARNSLLEVAHGVGPKQASLFLRNTGHAQSLAILDVHVLRFMNFTGLAYTQAASIQSLSIYERLERRLQDFADHECVSVGFLDIAIWVVMRVYQREVVQWRS